MRTLLAHMDGTWLMKRLLAMSSSCWDITTSPLRALSRSFRLCLMVPRSRLYLNTHTQRAHNGHLQRCDYFKTWAPHVKQRLAKHVFYWIYWANCQDESSNQLKLWVDQIRMYILVKDVITPWLSNVLSYPITPCCTLWCTLYQMSCSK